MGLKLNGSSSGSVELNAPASTTSGADVVLTLPVNDGDANQFLQTNGSGALTWATVTDTNTQITRGTAVTAATGSPTSIDFTDVPANCRRVTLILDAVGTNGTSRMIVRLGTGTAETPNIDSDGYSGTVSQFSSNAVGSEQMSTGFEIDTATNAAGQRNYTMFLHNVSVDRWTASVIGGRSDATQTVLMGGRVNLGNPLTVVRLTTTGGTDTFDNGLVNIFYEV